MPSALDFPKAIMTRSGPLLDLGDQWSAEVTGLATPPGSDGGVVVSAPVRGPVLDAARRDEKLTGPEPDRTVWHLDGDLSADDGEELAGYVAADTEGGRSQ